MYKRRVKQSHLTFQKEKKPIVKATPNSRIEVVRAIAKTAHLENNAVEKAPNTKK